MYSSFAQVALVRETLAYPIRQRDQVLCTEVTFTSRVKSYNDSDVVSVAQLALACLLVAYARVPTQVSGSVAFSASSQPVR